MADDEAAKAEKLAVASVAAKKRAEAMKKKQAKKSGASSAKKEQDGGSSTENKQPDSSMTEEAEAPEEVPTEQTSQPGSPQTTNATSASQQSKLRSSSFRSGGGPMSPAGTAQASPFVPSEGETAADIYRKQVARIEDLEKENKRLAKASLDSEKRWQKAEEELADLREADGEGAHTGGGGEEVEKLRIEVASLQRQNSQLLTAAASRRGNATSPSTATSLPPSAELEAQLESKAATIETMELELSRLRAQAARQASAGGTDKDQIAALEEKLARAEQAATKATRELTDLKRETERTAEKAVKEGSSRTSAETRVRVLETEVTGLKEEKTELQKKLDALEKKVTALANLHKENDHRTQALRKEKEAAEKEVVRLKSAVEKLEAENRRLSKKDAAEGGGDDDGVEELENEERLRLQKKVRDLESEVYDLRRGIWHRRRKELEPGIEGSDSGFTNIDLSTSPVSPTGIRKQSKQGSGIGNFFSTLTGAQLSQDDHDGLLDDEELDFDEEEFRRAQEEEDKRRLERIKEVKRGLKNWEGWRLDLAECRRGVGSGFGEIFEV